LFVYPDTYQLLVRSESRQVARLTNVVALRDEAKQQDINLKQGVRFEAQVIDSISKQPFPDFVLWDFKHPAVLGRSDEDGTIVIEGMLPGPFQFNAGEGESKNYRPVLSNRMPMAISAVDSTSSLIRNAISRGKTRLPLNAVSAHAKCILSESGAIQLANSFLPTDGKSLVFFVDVCSVGCELLDRRLLRKLGHYRRIFRCWICAHCYQESHENQANRNALLQISVA